jgi:hypothetical protein
MGRGLRGLLAVIGDDAGESEAVVERAAALAGESHSRLAIAAIAHVDSRLNWLAGLALTQSCLGPRRDELETEAQHRLARAAEFIPATVGLTTMVIAEPPRRALRRLLADGQYDLLVIGARLAGRGALVRLPIPALVVPRGESASAEALARVQLVPHST